jgi:hypothetical protein
MGRSECLRFTHCDLVSFADDKVNLKKAEVDDQRAQVNRLRNRIESKIAASPGYRPDCATTMPPTPLALRKARRHRACQVFRQPYAATLIA